MPRTRIAPVAIVAGLMFAACTDADTSAWATEANKICSDVASTWSTLDPNSVSDDDRQRLLSDLREVAQRLAAHDGGSDAAVEAVSGLESLLADMDSGEDRERLLSDLREVAQRLAAHDGGSDAAVEAVSGLESLLADMDSGEVPTDLEWVSALREAGAEVCWSIFQGSPSGLD